MWGMQFIQICGQWKYILASQTLLFLTEISKIFKAYGESIVFIKLITSLRVPTWWWPVVMITPLVHFQVCERLFMLLYDAYNLNVPYIPTNNNKNRPFFQVGQPGCLGDTAMPKLNSQAVFPDSSGPRCSSTGPWLIYPILSYPREGRGWFKKGLPGCRTLSTIHFQWFVMENCETRRSHWSFASPSS